jgi:hypothetical protein
MWKPGEEGEGGVTSPMSKEGQSTLLSIFILFCLGISAVSKNLKVTLVQVKYK